MSVVNQIEFNIDMVPHGERPVVHVSEGDIGRTYKANLFYNGVSFTPTDVSEVELTGLYPNDSAPAPATGSWSSGNSYVTFTLPADFCKISGQLLCEIRLKDTSDNDIGSGNFVLMVERGYSENAAIVDFPTVSDAINEAVQDATEAADTATEAATSASGSATAAAASAAQAMSGTPDGYAALVDDVDALKKNISRGISYITASSFKEFIQTAVTQLINDGIENGDFFGGGKVWASHDYYYFSGSRCYNTYAGLAVAFSASSIAYYFCYDSSSETLVVKNFSLTNM